jgi:C_GCAxxG_C_C family probable redox protein
MDYAELAKKNHNLGFACSQAVLLAFATELGLDAGIAARIASGFGGGMGRNGRTCGAVSGAVMVVGLAFGGTLPTDKEAKERAYAMSRRVQEEFQARCGSLDCPALLGVDISTAEGLARAHAEKRFARCDQYIEEAARIVSEVLKENHV